MTAARRLPVRGLIRSARRALRLGRGLLAAPTVLAVSVSAGNAQPIAAAAYAEPTTRYAHGVLGDAVEHGALVLTLADGSVRVFVLPDERVFEDTAPRLADVTGDRGLEVIVVESHRDLGARLAVYGGAGLIDATPWIGRPFRWLAPVGAADLDGDGAVEIAYIDRPHLARTLRVWRFSRGRLTEVAALGGLTNHRIGERDIGGGIRDCGAGLEMITANASWTRVMATRLTGGTLQTRAIAPYRDRASFAAALACRD